MSWRRVKRSREATVTLSKPHDTAPPHSRSPHGPHTLTRNIPTYSPQPHQVAELKKNAKAAAAQAAATGGDVGYFASLATKIVDNLFVYLKNIHLRCVTGGWV